MEPTTLLLWHHRANSSCNTLMQPNRGWIRDDGAGESPVTFNEFVHSDHAWTLVQRVRKPVGPPLAGGADLLAAMWSTAPERFDAHAHTHCKGQSLTQYVVGGFKNSHGTASVNGESLAAAPRQIPLWVFHFRFSFTFTIVFRYKINWTI